MSDTNYRRLISAGSDIRLDCTNGTKWKHHYELVGTALSCELLHELFALGGGLLHMALRAEPDSLHETSKPHSPADGFAIDIVNDLWLGVANLLNAEAKEAAK